MAKWLFAAAIIIDAMAKWSSAAAASRAVLNFCSYYTKPTMAMAMGMAMAMAMASGSVIPGQRWR